jgi:hypothetical protein
MEVRIGFNIITGMMVGFEHVHLEDIHYLVFDFLFLRLTFEFESGD